MTVMDIDGKALKIGDSDLEDFEAAARRPLSTRIHYSFIHTFKPVLDECTYRSFESMAEYRRWCADNLPSWLGYGPGNPSER